MKLADIGINENRGGGVLFVTGTVAKNQSWSMVDRDTKEHRSGHSFDVAFYGGVFKVKTEDDDPLRGVGVGEEIALRINMSAPKGKAEQLGPALRLDPLTLKSYLTPTPSSA